MNKKAQKGFTLVEVMMVIVILGILLSIAVPSYSKFATKSRRADATYMLLEVAGEQQRFLSDNNRYATSISELGYDSIPLFSEHGLYEITVRNPSVTSFILTASPVAGKPQESDTECGDFTLRSNGVQTADGGPDCW